MAEMETPSPIYCMGNPSDNNALTTMAALGNCGGQWNNPFIYLVWMMFANRFFGNGYGYGYGDGSGTPEILAKLNSISSQLSNNQNTNLMMDAIGGNHEALHQLQTALSVDYATLSGAISGVQNAITHVGGQVGMTGQEVINSVLLGNKDLTAAMQSCCCENKMLALQNTNSLQNQISATAYGTQRGIDDVKQAIVSGLSTIGYQNAQHTEDIIQNNNFNTQRIIDQLNTHWTAELSQELQNAKFEQSQLKQNVYLGGLINGGTAPASIW